MMQPPGWITDVPGVTRNEALKLCGNGVVTPQAVHALRVMLNRIGMPSRPYLPTAKAGGFSGGLR